MRQSSTSLGQQQQAEAQIQHHHKCKTMQEAANIIASELIFFICAFQRFFAQSSL